MPFLAYSITRKTEVTAQDQYFPAPYPIKQDCYYYLVGFRRGGSGALNRNGGTAHHTPAISFWGLEWQTFDYESQPYKEQYPSFSQGASLETELALSRQAQSTSKEDQQRVSSLQRIAPPNHLSVNDLESHISEAGGSIVSFELEYETTDSLGKTDRMVVRGVPDGGILIPWKRVETLLKMLPPGYSLKRFVGIRAYTITRFSPEPLT